MAGILPKPPIPLLPRSKPILRLKFLRIMGGSALGLAGVGAVVAAEAQAASGETITVPAGPLHGTIAVVVAVNPAKNVIQVELFVDGNQIGTDTTSPYAFVWDTTTVSDGAHQLRADSVYKTRRHSGTLAVTVQNGSPPPPTSIFPSNTLYPSETAP